MNDPSGVYNLKSQILYKLRELWLLEPGEKRWAETGRVVEQWVMSLETKKKNYVPDISKGHRKGFPRVFVTDK